MNLGKINTSTFLVTGGAGFIGSNLVEFLLKHEARKIRVLDNLSTGNLENIREWIDKGLIEFIDGDIRDLEVCKRACEGIDFVSHQAALGSVPRSVQDPVTTNAVNSDGFLNMLVAARDANVKRIVYASSSSVYGDNTELPKLEAKTGNPLSPYAVTKKNNELYADVFARNYDMKIIGLRYFNIFGPRQSPNGEYAALIPRFIKALMNNTSPVIFGDGEQGRDFTFIDNAVQANVKALLGDNENALNKVYNIACAERVTVNQLFVILKEISGATVDVNYAEPRKGDIRDSLADISAAQALLDYQPSVRFKEGLVLTYNWFKSKGQSL